VEYKLLQTTVQDWEDAHGATLREDIFLATGLIKSGGFDPTLLDEPGQPVTSSMQMLYGDYRIGITPLSEGHGDIVNLEGYISHSIPPQILLV